MTNHLYSRLAFSNIKRNISDYLPFMLSSIFTVAMNYIMLYLYYDDTTQGSGSLSQMLMLGFCFVAIFTVIIIFYANSFLIKRRTKEFGLYNVLGMRKSQVAKVIFLEMSIIALSSIIIGTVFGIAFSKATQLLLVRLMRYGTGYGFQISLNAILLTTALFIIIFFAATLSNIIKLYKNNSTELLKSGKVGDREPKAKWFITLIGIICLISGYLLAISVNDPISAMILFFVAVLLVIAGTYCLFTSGSIVLLKLLRKNKKYYYKPNHFISVSGMMYRMKQNAVGLASICILSTMVLVTVSTTFSLYFGVKDSIDTMQEKDIEIVCRVSDEKFLDIQNSVSEKAQELDLSIQNSDTVEYVNFLVIQSENTFTTKHDDRNMGSDIAYFSIITLEQYNKLNNSSLEISDGVLLACLDGNLNANSLFFENTEYKIEQFVPSVKLTNSMSQVLSNEYILIAKDNDSIIQITQSLNMTDLKFIKNYSFNVSGTSTDELNLFNAISRNNIDKITSKEALNKSFYEEYGCLMFLGIILGIVFLVATVLILYYKQITEGYDDEKRFDILQKVGMDDKEIKKTIGSEVLTMFSFPLLMAFVHVIFAFPMLKKLLLVLRLDNQPLFIICTIATAIVFTLFYMFVYTITAKKYYKIIKRKT